MTDDERKEILDIFLTADSSRDKKSGICKNRTHGLINRDERMTFAELDARSEAFAAWLLGWFGNDRAPVVICGEKESNFLLDVCREKGIKPLFIHVPFMDSGATTPALQRTGGRNIIL